MAGEVDKAKGHLKEAIGDLTDDERLEREGKADKAAGKTKSAAGKVADTVADAADDVRDRLKR
jgi:uncharacterized protein YjbJ (UPF0337 family)